MNEQTTVTESSLRGRYQAACQETGLPRHMWEALVEYLMIGRPLPEFLEAIVSNNFITAVKKADDLNSGCFKNYATFLESVAPVTCWGSPSAYQGWVRMGGVLGRSRARHEGSRG